jgi:uncharacterized membrane protein
VTALIAACSLSVLAVIFAISQTPHSIRIALGVVMVFGLPGFAILASFGSALQLGWGEFLLACLGISIAIATCLALVLGATPIGLSSFTFSIVLSGITVIASLCAMARGLPSNR